MPELPEVDITRRGIEPYLAGHTILGVEVCGMQLRWPVDERIIAQRNQRILSVQRRAKYLLLELKKVGLLSNLACQGGCAC